ncbi:MAG: hypothetical protein R3186_05560 [Ruegeria sp.]|nr:hypothetical protein [Ruegeria sp.]
MDRILHPDPDGYIRFAGIVDTTGRGFWEFCCCVQALVAKFPEAFKELPPTAGDSLSVDAVIAEMQRAASRQQSLDRDSLVFDKKSQSIDWEFLFSEKPLAQGRGKAIRDIVLIHDESQKML